MSTYSKLCIVCEAPGAQQCSSCKTAFYCTKEHQKKDWRAHKAYCLAIKAAGTQTYNAILFPVNERKPRIVKIPWQTRCDEDDGIPWTKLDTDVWYKNPGDSSVRNLYFSNLGINGPDLGRCLCIRYDDNFLRNNSPLNKCIVHITGGEAGHPWSGNVLGLRMASLHSYDHYESAVMEEDLDLFVKYFDEYNKVVPR